jgi:hypothetical protein
MFWVVIGVHTVPKVRDMSVRAERVQHLARRRTDITKWGVQGARIQVAL